MNMHQSINTTDIVVFFAFALALAFVLAWCVSPALRNWIERPKYRFQKNLQSFEQSVHVPLRSRKESE